MIISTEKTPGCLGLIGDCTTQLYLGIISSHYKDPFLSNQDSMECQPRVLLPLLNWFMVDIRYYTPVN